jgi:hypothetical protein
MSQGLGVGTSVGLLWREMYYESVCSSLNYYACRGKGAAWLPPED